MRPLLARPPIDTLRTVRAWSLALALILMAGCAHQTGPLTPVENLKRYQERLAAIDDWRLRGKIIVRSAGEAEKARVSWQNRPRSYKIRFSGTLGMGTTYLYGSPDSVRLEQSGEPPLVAATPEELIYQQMGQHIPISELKYWVRGIPSPHNHIDDLTMGPNGTVTALGQSGWLLRYSDYRPVGPWNLPGELVAYHPDVELRVTIDQWDLASYSE